MDLQEFVRFSFPHGAALIVLALFGTALILWLRRINLKSRRWILGSLCALTFLFSLITRLFYVGIDQYVDCLPLHFCSFIEIACILACIFNTQLYKGLVYYGGLAACLQGLLTPALTANFPHPVFFAFFLSHGCIVIAALAMPLCLEWRSQAWEILKIQGIGCLYLLSTLPLNFMCDTNYGFTRMLPVEGSILDYFGAWPYYLIIMQIPVFAILYLLSIPVKNRKLSIENLNDGSTA